MKKATSLLLILALMLTLFSGCHGAREQLSFRIPENFDTTRQYEITFWAKNDTNVTQADIYRKAIADFELLYPNITVNMRLYPDYSRIYNDVITNIATATTPNLCITYPDHIATYLTGENIVVPLDELLVDSRSRAPWQPVRVSSSKSSRAKVVFFIPWCLLLPHRP